MEIKLGFVLLTCQS